MKNCSKIFSMFIMSVLLIMMFTSCGEEVVVNGDWEVDKDSHWNLTESGKKVNVEAHSLENSFCSVCGAEVMQLGDEIWVQKYDEQGAVCLRISYDSDGEVIKHNKFEYTYDENGYCDIERIYDADGKLYQENDYTTIFVEDQSFTSVEQTTTYNQDGTKKVETNDQNGWTIKEAIYKADGSLEYEYTIVNELNDEGLIAGVKKYDGETLAVEELHEYDSHNNPVAVKMYANGNLVEEEIYTTIDGYIYMSKKIAYNEDGTQIAAEYDRYGREIK